jgi:hypothetical protein
MSIKNINRRVIQWVPVAERLPDKTGVYHVKARREADNNLYKTVAIFTNDKDFLDVPWCVIVEWLDDRTWEVK